MSNIKMVEAKLPPGFRFHPKDEELVCDYLVNKINGCDSHHLFVEVDLNKCEPWDLPEKARVGGKEWYFFSKRDRKYATGVRTNRATARGYWKATGKDRRVVQKNCLVGMRKTLVFYQGRAPKGCKTEWIMHEFRFLSSFSVQEDWVLCRVLYKKREENSTSCSHDESGCSSSLPPLLEDSYITFDQTHNNDCNNHEQVSILSHDQTSLNFPQIHSSTDNLFNISFGINSNTTTNPIASTSNLDNNIINNFPSDEKVVKAFFNQLHTDMDMNSNNEGSPTNSESYLSEPVISNFWSDTPF